MSTVLWFIVIALFVLWIIGLGVQWATSIVWILFVAAVVLLIVNLLIGTSGRGRRTVT